MTREQGTLWASDPFSHGICLLAVLVLVYFLALPIACRLNNRRVPILLRPLAHALETPVYPAMEWYLGAWGVDPNLVRCAMYEP